MKQTSVEWLVDHFKEYGYDFSHHEREIEKAKEMEKQQIIDAYEIAMETDIYNVPLKVGEQYYNETFKTK